MFTEIHSLRIVVSRAALGSILVNAAILTGSCHAVYRGSTDEVITTLHAQAEGQDLLQSVARRTAQMTFRHNSLVTNPGSAVQPAELTVLCQEEPISRFPVIGRLTANNVRIDDGVCAAGQRNLTTLENAVFSIL